MIDKESSRSVSLHTSQFLTCKKLKLRVLFSGLVKSFFPNTYSGNIVYSTIERPLHHCACLTFSLNL